MDARTHTCATGGTLGCEAEAGLRCNCHALMEAKRDKRVDLFMPHAYSAALRGDLGRDLCPARSSSSAALLTLLAAASFHMEIHEEAPAWRPRTEQSRRCMKHQY